MQSTGLLYCAVGKEYYNQALLSYQSFLKKNEHLPAAIYTDQKTSLGLWANVLPIGNQYTIDSNNRMIFKLDALLKSPFENTLYLDSDTFILDTIKELFVILEKFDLAFCHGHHRANRYEQYMNWQGLKNKEGISQLPPYSFSPMQGGLIIFRKSKTLDFFQHLRDLYLQTGYYDDQAIFRNLLWESSLRFYVLPPEYNLFSVMDLNRFQNKGNKEAQVKIFHYTQNKSDNIEDLLSGSLKPKSGKKVFDWFRKILQKLSYHHNH